MKPFVWTALALTVCMPAVAQLVETAFFTGVNKSIPDNSLVGVSDTRDVQSNIASITDVQVTLAISGASPFNGDLYAYVTHGSGFAVLLNRPGRTATDPMGYDDGGMNVIFQDSAGLGDVHTYRLTLTGSADAPLPAPGILAGNWAPDGRNVLPSTVTDATARTALLSSFAGEGAGGAWTLFVADMGAGGLAEIQNWGLQMSGVAVPEPIATTLAGALALAGFVLLRHRLRSGKSQPSGL